MNSLENVGMLHCSDVSNEEETISAHQFWAFVINFPRGLKANYLRTKTS